MEMTHEDYQINKSKILEFLHGLKYAGPEFAELLQNNVSERICLVFNYIFFFVQISNFLLSSSQL